MSDMQKVVCRRKVIKCGIGGGGVKTHFYQNNEKNEFAPFSTTTLLYKLK